MADENSQDYKGYRRTTEGDLTESPPSEKPPSSDESEDGQD